MDTNTSGAMVVFPVEYMVSVMACSFSSLL